VKSKKVYLFRSTAILALALLAGCVAAVKTEDSSVINTRAVERWNFIVDHHAEKAYDFLSPGVRATVTREAYAAQMNNRPVRWNKVTFGSEECDADVCHVHLSVGYDVNLGGLAGKTKSFGLVTETWVRIKGQWFFLPDQFRPTKLGKET
jgi:hypothetical protein